MPEIAEYEKLLRQLLPAWKGRRVVKFTCPAFAVNVRPRKFYQGDWQEFLGHMTKHQITGMRRHGKNILGDTEGGWVWHIHLNSTGWWMPSNADARAACDVNPIHLNFLHDVSPANVRLKMHLDDGQVWNYHDARTWGKWFLRNQTDTYFDELGPDWLVDSIHAMYALRSHNSGRTVKAVLTDQNLTAGLGNYLACEACAKAGIHPHRRWNTLSEATKQKLAQTCHVECLAALNSDDHKHWKVFNRRGEPCLLHPNVRIEYAKDGPNGKRGSYFCPSCQPLE